jgi:hypothetical protein
MLEQAVEVLKVAAVASSFVVVGQGGGGGRNAAIEMVGCQPHCVSTFQNTASAVFILCGDGIVEASALSRRRKCRRRWGKKTGC